MDKDIEMLVKKLQSPTEVMETTFQINDPEKIKVITSVRDSIITNVIGLDVERFEIKLNEPFVFSGAIHLEGKGFILRDKVAVQKFVETALMSNCFSATTDFMGHVVWDFSFVNITKALRGDV